MAKWKSYRYFFAIPILLFNVSALVAQPAIDSSHHVPADKRLGRAWETALWSNEHKVYKGKELTTIGMPCGGIAAGQLYVRGDGTLAGWWICNNAYNTGYGKDSLMNFRTAMGPWKVCYQTFTPPSYIEQGATLSVTQGGKSWKKELSGAGFDDISFVGEYPVARINYASKKEVLPIKVSLDVYSPFIPLDARESATPGTVMTYTLKNESGQALDLTLTGRVQNLVCLDLKDSMTGTSRNRVVGGDGMTSVVMDVVKPGFKRGGVFPLDHPYNGNLAISVLGDQSFGDADHDATTEKAGGSGRSVQEKGVAKDVAIRPIGQKLTGAVGRSVHLGPGESRQITFLLTWYFPNRPSYYSGNDVTKILPNDWNEALPTKGATILGNMYANWYNSSEDVAIWLKGNLDRLSKETWRFHDTYYNNSTLPYWLNQRLLMPVSTLATETCQWWANGKFWAWEGVGSCVGTCTHVWNYEQALARLFPELERNIRERTDFGTSLQKDGSVLSRNGWGGVLIDGHAGAILKAYREHLFSDNGLFLSRNWPSIKRATEYLIGQDGDEDGLIGREQANTYDIAFFGANTYVGGLYLAALKAASNMALLEGDSLFARRCTKIFEKGRDNSVTRLWNGNYFRQDVDLSMHPKYQYANGCLSDQLFGQTWSHLVGLGYIYPEDKVKRTLESVWQFNWAPDVAVQNRPHPPERTYADAGEAGLLVCTWPFGPHMGEEGVRYRDEVWTGIEYQVATNMIYENMVKEGLSMVKAVDDRYDGTKHNPWNEIECGDHYARAMASWGVLMALEDYVYDGPQKKLGFSPRIQKNDFNAFFTGAEGWGSLGQKRKGDVQTNTINLRYGRLRLTSLETACSAQPKKVELSLGGKIIPCTYAFDKDRVIVRFDEVLLEEGGQLTLSVNTTGS
jgi:non-lysosomal glucosylceramidase